LRAFSYAKPGLGHFTCPAVEDSPFGQEQSLNNPSSPFDSADAFAADSATYEQCAAGFRNRALAVRRVHNGNWRLK
jgi:hypothetical protein